MFSVSYVIYKTERRSGSRCLL